MQKDKKLLVGLVHKFWKVRLDKFERGLRKQVGNGKALLSNEWGFGFKGVGKTCYAILRNGEIMEVNKVWDEWFCNNRSQQGISTAANADLLYGGEEESPTSGIDLSAFRPIVIDSSPQHIINTLGKKINWYLAWELICESYVRSVDPNDYRRLKLRASDATVYGVPDGFFRSWTLCLVRSQVLMPFQKEYTVLNNGRTACDYWYELAPYYASLLEDIAKEWPNKMNPNIESKLIEGRREKARIWQRKRGLLPKVKETKCTE